MAGSQEPSPSPNASPPNDDTIRIETPAQPPAADKTIETHHFEPESEITPTETGAQESAEQQQQEEEITPTQGVLTEQPHERHALPPGKIQISPYMTGQSAPNQPSAFSSNQRGSANHTPGPFSSWSAGSDRQLGHMSAGSDRSGDRVFPIRSVISVDPATSRTSGDDFAGSTSDFENRGIPVHRPSHTRGETSQGLGRADTGPWSPRSTSSSKKRPFGGRATVTESSQGIEPHQSSGRQTGGGGYTAPIELDIEASDKDSAESGALGAIPAEVAAAEKDTGASETSESASMADNPHVHVRFTHMETEDGHSVITGRDGTLQRCEDEPIHTPGAVQGFGALVALREESDGCLVVRYASENSERMLGYSPRQLFRLKNFMDILTEEQQDNLLDHIDFIRDEDADPSVNGPEVFSLSIRPPKKRSTKLWCAIHINPAHPDLVICEFELDDDHVNPLRPPDEATPDEPHDSLRANPSTEEMEQSTEILSKPLRILRSARKRRGEQGAMQVFDIMSQVQEQLSSAQSLETFLKILVGIVKELTGFHRVMIYQFDSAQNGKVVTELVDPAATKDLYYGLNFPASDIPRQARDLYKINKVRLLYDRAQETARIVCRTQEDLETPLDMTHSYLRAMSPIHLKYLGNMGVRSSMSISINALSELWGLIACHSYGDSGMRVSFPIRKMCRLVGDTASRNIERLSYASRLQARKLINTAPTDKNPSGYIIASSDDLLRLFDADFGLLSIRGETKIMGEIEQSQEALALLEYLRMRQLTSVLATQDVRQDFPDLRYPPGFQVVAGLLYVPLSVGGHDFIVFFRRGQIKEVKWAGNPYEKIIRGGTAGYLEPRSSFKTWSETVVGKCREWNEEQVETAAVLCLVYGKFIEVWRQKEAALQNSKLTRLLLANSAHEVRTPLNAIINYLEIALEGSLDSETRDNLARSHSASKSLIYVINDLLDLTKTEEGQSLVKDEVFDLPNCIKEATEPFRSDTRRKNLEYEVVEHPGLPQLVHGDGRRVRQALSNICANAVAHTSEGHIRVDVFVSEMRDDKVAVVDFAVSDSGEGMSTTQLDALFRDLEQVSTEEPDSKVLTEGSKASQGRTLGLGLAVVARMVRNMDGQLRLKSDEGQGSRFVVQLPFQLPDETPTEDSEGVHEDASSTAHDPTPKPTAASTAPASVTAAPEGEITLVDNASSMHIGADSARDISSMSKRKSASLNSRHSVDSGHTQGTHGSNKSDADRLIDALQTPLSLDDREPTYPLSRTRSRGSSTESRSRLSLRAAMAGGSGSPQAHKRKTSSPTQPRSEPGTAQVRDSKMPIRPVKIPDDFQDMPPRPQAGDNSGVLFEIPSEQTAPSRTNTESVTSVTTVDGQQELRVLIAEDDPINMKIMRKRLERTGHEVFHAVNGQDCAAVYKERSNDFDAVLMDMQMPIVDGLTSTQMIRACEKSPEHPGHSQLASSNGRIPIFAVSASLIEADKQKYINAGFDGWILKPIDFKRLNTLLTGICNDEVRKSCLYEPGEWERGGWFCERGMDVSSAEETTPTGKTENKDGLAIAGHEQAEAEAEAEVEVADKPTGEEAPNGAGEDAETATRPLYACAG